MREIMDCTCDPMVKETVVMKATQVAWTEVVNNTIGYHIHRAPAPILLLQPTLEMAEAWSKDRFAPMLRDTPCLTDKVADVRSRDSGNTLLHKRFHGGHITIVGANSPASLASRPIRILLCDEVDRFPQSAGTEGDPIDLARRRTATFRNRKVLMGSTPTVKGASRIEAAFEQSDQRYYFVPCPHCEEFQRLVWANVRWPDGKPELARYVCVHCGAEIEEHQKAEMLRLGEWRASQPFNGVAGFHISELYSPWSTWAEMARAFLRAKPFPETLQTWVNTALGETWEDSGEKLEPIGLLARVESYTAASIPAGVLLLVAGTDVQDDRLETFVYGFGADEECWRVEHRVLRGDPGGQALWKEHDDVLKKRYTTDDGRELVIEACCVDSGGHFTEQVYRYCAARKRYRVFAIKGAAGQGRLAWPKKAGRGKSVAVNVWLIGVDTIKALLYGRLRKITPPDAGEPRAGYIHFDAKADEEFFDQLTSETVVSKMSMGRKVQVWKPKKTGVRQEGLDGTVYAYAAMLARGGSELLAARAMQPRRIVEKPVERPAATAPAESFNQPQRQQSPRPRRGGWVKGWRW